MATRRTAGPRTPSLTRRAGPLLGVLGLGVLVLAGCVGGDADTRTGNRPAPARWVAYNRDRTGWTPAGRRAVEHAARVLAAELGCSPLAGENFDAWAVTYRSNGLPLPLAAGSCDLAGGEGETVLLEAFGRRPPTPADALAARTAAVCPRVRKEGLPGQPWVLTADRVLIQPDRPATAIRIGKAFPGAKVGAVCPEATRRFFDRLEGGPAAPAVPGTTAPSAPAPAG